MFTPFLKNGSGNVVTTLIRRIKSTSFSLNSSFTSSTHHSLTVSRSHSLLLTTSVATCCLLHHKLASSSSLESSNHEIPTFTPVYITSPHETLIQTPPAEKAASFWSYLEESFQWILNFFSLMKRLTLFGVYMTPTILTSPALVIGSSYLETRWWQLVRYSIFACGPCLTKFAQWAATRPDIFPTRLCKELELLQAKSFEHTWDETVRIFNEIYGPQWTEKLSLDRVSISGSGLVAQVYHGYLINEGDKQEVAVKILHPSVRKAMKEDLHLLAFIAQSLETTASYLTYWYYSLPFLHDYDPNVEVNRESFLDTTISLKDIVKEFDAFMTPQLDLRNEVIAMRRFKRNFRDIPWKNQVEFAEPIQFPLPILQNASTDSIAFDGDRDVHDTYSSEILLETYLQGIPMAQYLTKRSQLMNDEREHKKQKKFDQDVAALGLDIILKMIFDDNFIHGDMHPGNILLVPNEKGELIDEKPRFRVVDYGLTTHLTKADRQNLILLFKAVIDKNGREVGRLMIEKSRIQQQVIDAEGFKDEMQEIVDDAFREGLKLRNSGVSKLLNRVLNHCYKHRVRLESNFSAIILSIGVIEGLGIQLDPDADVVQRAAPFILKTAARDYGLR